MILYLFIPYFFVVILSPISYPGGMIIIFSPLKSKLVRVFKSISQVPWEVKSVIVIPFFSKFVFLFLFDSFNLRIYPDAEILAIWWIELLEYPNFDVSIP